MSRIIPKNYKGKFIVEDSGEPINNALIYVEHAPSVVVYAGSSRGEVASVKFVGSGTEARLKQIAIGAAYGVTYGVAGTTASMSIDAIKVDTIYGGALATNIKGKIVGKYTVGVSAVVNGGVDITLLNTTIKTVYGGGAGYGAVTNGNVTINYTAGSSVGTIYGGGTTGAVVNGNVAINVAAVAKGALRTIYAGGNNSVVTGGATVTFAPNGGMLNFTGTVSGAGKGSKSRVDGTKTLVFSNYGGQFAGTIKSFDVVQFVGATSVTLTKGQDKTLKGATYEFVITDETYGLTGAMLTMNKKASLDKILVTMDSELFSRSGGTVILVESKYFKTATDFNVSTIRVQNAAGDLVWTGAYEFIYNFDKKLGGSVVLTYKGTAMAIDDEVKDNITLTDADEILDIKAGAKVTGNIDMAGGDDKLTIQTGAQLSGNVSMGDGNDLVTVQKGAEVTGTIDMGKGNDKIIVEREAIIASVRLGEGTNHLIVNYRGQVEGTIFLSGNSTNIIDVNSGAISAIHGGDATTKNIITLDGTLESVTTRNGVVVTPAGGVGYWPIDGGIFVPAGLYIYGASNDKIVLNANASVAAINTGKGQDVFVINNLVWDNTIITDDGNDVIVIGVSRNVNAANFNLGGTDNTLVVTNGRIVNFNGFSFGAIKDGGTVDMFGKGIYLSQNAIANFDGMTLMHNYSGVYTATGELVIAVAPQVSADIAAVIGEYYQVQSNGVVSSTIYLSGNLTMSTNAAVSGSSIVGMTGDNALVMFPGATITNSMVHLVNTIDMKAGAKIAGSTVDANIVTVTQASIVDSTVRATAITAVNSSLDGTISGDTVILNGASSVTGVAVNAETLLVHNTSTIATDAVNLYGDATMVVDKNAVVTSDVVIGSALGNSQFSNDSAEVDVRGLVDGDISVAKADWADVYVTGAVTGKIDLGGVLNDAYVYIDGSAGSVANSGSNAFELVLTGKARVGSVDLDGGDDTVTFIADAAGRGFNDAALVLNGVEAVNIGAINVVVGAIYDADGNALAAENYTFANNDKGSIKEELAMRLMVGNVTGANAGLIESAVGYDIYIRGNVNAAVTFDGANVFFSGDKAYVNGMIRILNAVQFTVTNRMWFDLQQFTGGGTLSVHVADDAIAAFSGVMGGSVQMGAMTLGTNSLLILGNVATTGDRSSDFIFDQQAWLTHDLHVGAVALDTLEVVAGATVQSIGTNIANATILVGEAAVVRGDISNFQNVQIGDNAQLWGHIATTDGDDTVVIGDGVVINGRADQYNYAAIITGAGADEITIGRSAVNGVIDSGAGADTINLNGTVVSKAVNQPGAVVKMGGDDNTLNLSGATINGNVAIDSGAVVASDNSVVTGDIGFTGDGFVGAVGASAGDVFKVGSITGAAGSELTVLAANAQIQVGKAIDFAKAGATNTLVLVDGGSIATGAGVMDLSMGGANVSSENNLDIMNTAAEFASVTMKAAGDNTINLGPSNYWGDVLAHGQPVAVDGTYDVGGNGINLHDGMKVEVGAFATDATLGKVVMDSIDGVNTFMAGYYLAANGESEINVTGDGAINVVTDSVTMTGRDNRFDASISFEAGEQSIINVGANNVSVDFVGDVTMLGASNTAYLGVNRWIEESNDPATRSGSLIATGTYATSFTGDLVMGGANADSELYIGDNATVNGSITMGKAEKDVISNSNTLEITVDSATLLGISSITMSARTNTAEIDGSGDIQSGLLTINGGSNTLTIGENVNFLGTVEFGHVIDADKVGAEGYISDGGENTNNVANIYGSAAAVDTSSTDAGDVIRVIGGSVAGDIATGNARFVNADGFVGDKVELSDAAVGGSVSMGTVVFDADGNPEINSNEFDASGSTVAGDVAMTAGVDNTFTADALYDADGNFVAGSAIGGAVTMTAGGSNAATIAESTVAGNITMDAEVDNSLNIAGGMLPRVIENGVVVSYEDVIRATAGDVTQNAGSSDLAGVNILDIAGAVTLGAISQFAEGKEAGGIPYNSIVVNAGRHVEIQANGVKVAEYDAQAYAAGIEQMSSDNLLSVQGGVLNLTASGVTQASSSDDPTGDVNTVGVSADAALVVGAAGARSAVTQGSVGVLQGVIDETGSSYFNADGDEVLVSNTLNGIAYGVTESNVINVEGKLTAGAVSQTGLENSIAVDAANNTLGVGSFLAESVTQNGGSMLVNGNPDGGNSFVARNSARVLIGAYEIEAGTWNATLDPALAGNIVQGGIAAIGHEAYRNNLEVGTGATAALNAVGDGSYLVAGNLIQDASSFNNIDIVGNKLAAVAATATEPAKDEVVVADYVKAVIQNATDGSNRAAFELTDIDGAVMQIAGFVADPEDPAKVNTSDNNLFVSGDDLLNADGNTVGFHVAVVNGDVTQVAARSNAALFYLTDIAGNVSQMALTGNNSLEFGGDWGGVADATADNGTVDELLGQVVLNGNVEMIALDGSNEFDGYLAAINGDIDMTAGFITDPENPAKVNSSSNDFSLEGEYAWRSLWIENSAIGNADGAVRFDNAYTNAVVTGNITLTAAMDNEMGFDAADVNGDITAVAEQGSNTVTFQGGNRTGVNDLSATSFSADRKSLVFQASRMAVTMNHVVGDITMTSGFDFYNAADADKVKGEGNTLTVTDTEITGDVEMAAGLQGVNTLSMTGTIINGVDFSAAGAEFISALSEAQLLAWGADVSYVTRIDGDVAMTGEGKIAGGAADRVYLGGANALNLGRATEITGIVSQSNFGANTINVAALDRKEYQDGSGNVTAVVEGGSRIGGDIDQVGLGANTIALTQGTLEVDGDIIAQGFAYDGMVGLNGNTEFAINQTQTLVNQQAAVRAIRNGISNTVTVASSATLATGADIAQGGGYVAVGLNGLGTPNNFFGFDGVIFERTVDPASGNVIYVYVPDGQQSVKATDVEFLYTKSNSIAVQGRLFSGAVTQSGGSNSVALTAPATSPVLPGSDPNANYYDGAAALPVSAFSVESVEQSGMTNLINASGRSDMIVGTYDSYTYETAFDGYNGPINVGKVENFVGGAIVQTDFTRDFNDQFSVLVARSIIAADPMGSLLDPNAEWKQFTQNTISNDASNWFLSGDITQEANSILLYIPGMSINNRTVVNTITLSGCLLAKIDQTADSAAFNGKLTYNADKSQLIATERISSGGNVWEAGDVVSQAAKIVNSLTGAISQFAADGSNVLNLTDTDVMGNVSMIADATDKQPLKQQYSDLSNPLLAIPDFNPANNTFSVTNSITQYAEANAKDSVGFHYVFGPKVNTSTIGSVVLDARNGGNNVTLTMVTGLDITATASSKVNQNGNALTATDNSLTINGGVLNAFTNSALAGIPMLTQAQVGAVTVIGRRIVDGDDTLVLSQAEIIRSEVGTFRTTSANGTNTVNLNNTDVDGDITMTAEVMKAYNANGSEVKSIVPAGNTLNVSGAGFQSAREVTLSYMGVDPQSGLPVRVDTKFTLANTTDEDYVTIAGDVTMNALETNGKSDLLFNTAMFEYANITGGIAANAVAFNMVTINLGGNYVDAANRTIYGTSVGGDIALSATRGGNMLAMNYVDVDGDVTLGAGTPDSFAAANNVVMLTGGAAFGLNQETAAEKVSSEIDGNVAMTAANGSNALTAGWYDITGDVRQSADAASNSGTYLAATNTIAMNLGANLSYAAWQANAADKPDMADPAYSESLLTVGADTVSYDGELIARKGVTLPNSKIGGNVAQTNAHGGNAAILHAVDVAGGITQSAASKLNSSGNPLTTADNMLTLTGTPAQAAVAVTDRNGDTLVKNSAPVVFAAIPAMYTTIAGAVNQTTTAGNNTLTANVVTFNGAIAMSAAGTGIGHGNNNLQVTGSTIVGAITMTAGAAKTNTAVFTNVTGASSALTVTAASFTDSNNVVTTGANMITLNASTTLRSITATAGVTTITVNDQAHVLANIDLSAVAQNTTVTVAAGGLVSGSILGGSAADVITIHGAVTGDTISTGAGSDIVNIDNGSVKAFDFGADSNQLNITSVITVTGSLASGGTTAISGALSFVNAGTRVSGTFSGGDVALDTTGLANGATLLDLSGLTGWAELTGGDFDVRLGTGLGSYTLLSGKEITFNNAWATSSLTVGGVNVGWTWDAGNSWFTSAAGDLKLSYNSTNKDLIITKIA